ncbi:MAG: hypothetical protein ACO1RA_19510 [Planctomycetaceae bacterium]
MAKKKAAPAKSAAKPTKKSAKKKAPKKAPAPQVVEVATMTISELTGASPEDFKNVGELIAQVQEDMEDCKMLLDFLTQFKPATKLTEKVELDME